MNDSEPDQIKEPQLLINEPLLENGCVNSIDTPKSESSNTTSTQENQPKTQPTLIEAKR